MSTSVEAAIGKLSGQVEILLTRDERAGTDRKALYEKVEEVSRQVQQLDGRVATVEVGLADNQPTIKEFITIKHKVQAAGALGKWLWGLGGVILTIAAFIFTKAGEYFTVIPK